MESYTKRATTIRDKVSTREDLQEVAEDIGLLDGDLEAGPPLEGMVVPEGYGVRDWEGILVPEG